ncbi:MULTISPECIES: peptidase M23 [Sediminimonas]|uniref:peptidase M23 n=1 Tax=Sediminimonas TaxID=659427 RepID=UPI00040B9211|nr:MULTISPECIES: peptidase M23 [Sediminimonas]MDR9484621.1 peptidase M23 [Sediminimonas sp.]
MRQLFLTLPALLVAHPAAAHGGAHTHPHDGAQWLAVTSALVVAALIALAWSRRK